MAPTRRILSAAAAVLVAIGPSAATGCGTGGPRTARAGDAAGRARVTDCGGRPVEVSAPPRRVVTLTPSVLEMMFWLGLGDRVVGTGVPPPKGTFPPRFEAAAQRVRRLSGPYRAGAYRPVSREVLLGVRPDFVIGGFSSNFTAEGATGQDELAQRGVPSYLALSTACDGTAAGPRRDMSLVERDLTNLGRLFGVEDRARGLVAAMRAKTGQVAARLRGTSERPSVFAFEYEEGTDSPYAPGNRQTINAVIARAGGRNVFADLDRAYERVGWEEIVRRDPDVILIIVYGKGDRAADQAAAGRAQRFLAAHPPVRGLRAVRDRRFAALVYEDGSVGGVRNADAVVSLARQLHPGTVP